MTPAIHFYAPPPPKPNTSLSSMATMAAALVGGFISSSSHQGDDHEDTISPTASMITNQSPENLMLPIGGPQTEADKQQHLLWLQHINAMAQMARQPTGVVAAAAAGYAPPVYPQPHAAVSTTPASATASSNVETEEKRVRRLARNRESARQSRLRKKERLTTVEQKVSTLFGQLEEQRRIKIMQMEPQLQLARQEELEQLDETRVTREELQTFLQDNTTGYSCSCNNPVRERVMVFQFEKLRQYLLPRHEEFLLWLTLQPDTFFTSLKDKKAACQKTGRISSKQIGEELWSSYELSSKTTTSDDNNQEDKISTFDVDQIWPLYCFELLVSVDQEERLLMILKRIRDSPKITEYRAKMALATKMVELTKQGVLFQAHAASMRTHTTLLEILTPEQSVRFLKYMAANRPAARPSQTQTNDATLEDICKRLEQVLRLG
jgi:hypothetical protein